MANAATRRKQRRASEEASARARVAELEHRLAERNEEMDRRQRRIWELESSLQEERETVRDLSDMLREAHSRALSLDCRVVELEDEARQKDAALDTESDNSYELGSVQQVCRRYGYADGEEVSDWLEGVLADAEALGNDKLRRRLHERTRQLSEARAELGRREEAKR